MREERLERLCRNLKPLIGKRADRLWLEYRIADTPKARLEAEAMIELFASKHLGSNVSETAINLPPPSIDSLKGEFEIGNCTYQGRNRGLVGLSRTDLTKHVGVFSITGGGKTNLCLNLLKQFIAKGVPFLVLDWKRSFRMLCQISSEVRVLSVGRNVENAFRWNPLQAPPGVHPKTWISVVAEALETSHVSGQGVAEIFILLFDELFERNGVYDGTNERLPNFSEALERLKSIKGTGRRQLWMDSCQRILRTFVFGPASISFNDEKPSSFQELLEKQVVLELDMELPKPLRIFTSEITIRWIHLYRLGQGEKQTLRHVTILEECHNLFNNAGIYKTTSSLETAVRELRSFGQGIIFITQHPSLLPIYILGNCNTLAFLGLQHEEDIQAARKSLFLEYEEAKYLDLLKVGEAIVKVKNRITPAHVKIPKYEEAKNAA